MSKATPADSTSATAVEESSVESEPSVESRGEAMALTPDTSGARDPLYGTDRAIARALIEKANYPEHTEIRAVKLERYGESLNVRLEGTICLSYSDVERVIDGVYDPSDLLSHSSGNVTVSLSTR